MSREAPLDMLTMSDKERHALKLANRNFSDTKIAREIGCSRSTAFRLRLRAQAKLEEIKKLSYAMQRGELVDVIEDFATAH